MNKWEWCVVVTPVDPEDPDSRGTEVYPFESREAMTEWVDKAEDSELFDGMNFLLTPTSDPTVLTQNRSDQ